LKYYSPLKIQSKIVKNILDKVEISKDSDWIFHSTQDIFLLSIDDFKLDPKIVEIIEEFGDKKRIGVYKLAPNVCYNWHFVGKRKSSINMLLVGFDSLCIFGTDIGDNRLSNLDVLTYHPNTYYLMNVKELHTVLNFNNMRYVLSISLPNYDYEDLLKIFEIKKLL